MRMYKSIAVGSHVDMKSAITAGLFGGLMEAVFGGHTAEKLLTELTTKKSGPGFGSFVNTLSTLYGRSFLFNVASRPSIVASLTLGLHMGDVVNEALGVSPVAWTSALLSSFFAGAVSASTSFINDALVFNSISGSTKYEYLMQRYNRPFTGHLVLSSAVRNMAFSLGPYAAYPAMDHALRRLPVFAAAEDAGKDYAFARKCMAIMTGGAFSAVLSHPLHVASVHQHTDEIPQRLVATIRSMSRDGVLWRGLSLRIFRLGVLSIVPVYSIDWFHHRR